MNEISFGTAEVEHKPELIVETGALESYFVLLSGAVFQPLRDDQVSKYAL